MSGAIPGRILLGASKPIEELLVRNDVLNNDAGFAVNG
jgi:hypothetical protein